MKTQPMLSPDLLEDVCCDDFDAAPVPALRTVRRKRLPTGVASNVKQHVVLACDVSSSMSGAKISELAQAREALVQTLAHDDNRDGFLLTVIDFNHAAQQVCFAQSAQTLALPEPQASGGTNFEAALTHCLTAINAFDQRLNEDGWTHLRPVVLFLSDGHSAADASTIEALQEEAAVIAIAYGADADQAMLSRISSEGDVKQIGVKGDQLRAFLAEVGHTLSQTLQTAG